MQVKLQVYRTHCSCSTTAEIHSKKLNNAAFNHPLGLYQHLVTVPLFTTAELPGVWLCAQQDDRRRVQGHDHVNADLQGGCKVTAEATSAAACCEARGILWITIR
jgi:hypothetical protein